MTTKGLYIHIPYCLRRCNYCDFCSSATSRGVDDAYLDRIIREAESYREVDKLRVDTVYFGGGTPSLLSERQLDRLMGALCDVFDFCEGSEITLEANPGTLTAELCRAYKRLGFNRVSMGLQSIHENELKILGRIHNYRDFQASYSALLSAGIDNLNVDLMYGLPEQTTDSFMRTLCEVLTLEPRHISAYGLILEEGTPLFARKDSLRFPSEDEECEMYYSACERLSASGYSHYEISNYARAGYESRHNLKYWRDEEYIGLGASAHSYFRNRRFANTSDIRGYIESDNSVVYSEELSLQDQAFEYAMMGLRLSAGISLEDYYARFGVDFLSGREEKIDGYISMGLMRFSGGRVCFTERGFYLSNTLLCELL